MGSISQLWDRADFEAISKMKLASVHRNHQTKYRESIAAVQLLTMARKSSKIDSLGTGGNSKFKVLTVLHASLPHHTGGYTSRAQGLLSGLVSNGVELAAYTRPGFYTEILGEDALVPFPEETVDNVIYHHLPSSFQRRIGEFQYMLASVEKYVEVLKRENPNVVHVRSTYVIALPAMIAAHSLGIPVLYEISGLWELVFEGRKQFGRQARTIRMENATVELADTVVTMNTAMAQLLKNRIDKEIEIGLVPNAVTPEKFSDVKPLREIKNTKYDIGYVGSLVDYEGHVLLLQAIAYLKSKGKNVRVKIVGKGAEADRIASVIESEGLTDLVNLAGPVAADQVMKEFNEFRMVILPRLSTPATENVTPLKPFEAMASGRPLIVSDVAALEEVSRAGKAALTFKAGDYKSLADSIEKLIASPKLQQSMVDYSYDLIKREHSWGFVGGLMYEYLRKTALSRPRLQLQSSDVREVFSNGLSFSAGIVKR